MTYDAENRLLKVVNGGTTLNLTYDPEGRLYTTSANGTTTTFLYDGTNLIGEYNGTTLQRRYVHGMGVDEPLVWFEGSGFGTKRYFVQNYQGSVIGYTDSTGALVEAYKYGPYGEPKDNNAWTGSRFRYTGQTMLAEANLYYYKARVYDPKMGRFLQTDPIGSKDDLDLYAYVGGDPVNKSDPTGLCGGGRSVKDPAPGVPCDYTKNTHGGRGYQPSQADPNAGGGVWTFSATVGLKGSGFGYSKQETNTVVCSSDGCK